MPQINYIGKTYEGIKHKLYVKELNFILDMLLLIYQQINFLFSCLYLMMVSVV